MCAMPEEMDSNQEEMKSNQERMEAKMDPNHAMIDAWLKEIKARGRIGYYQGTGGPMWRPASGCKAPRTSEETDPGRWWVPEEVGRRLHTDDPPCRSCTA
jgi:hypothetical protein